MMPAKRILMALVLSFAAFTAKATTCTQPNDWPAICAAAVGQGRCVVSLNNMVARGACVKETAGCAEIGGCWGYTPIGHWYPYVENGVTFRCTCGCFADSTDFVTASGLVSGFDLMANRDSESTFSLETLDGFDLKGRSFTPINGIIYGPENELSYKITTQSGRSVTLSKNHPVLTVDAKGDVRALRAAMTLKVGDFLLTDEHSIDPVASIDLVEFKGQMVNFNVSSSDAGQHVVTANGLMLGDNAWQQRLAAEEGRILWRAQIVKELQGRSAHTKAPTEEPKEAL